MVTRTYASKICVKPPGAPFMVVCSGTSQQFSLAGWSVATFAAFPPTAGVLAPLEACPLQQLQALHQDGLCPHSALRLRVAHACSSHGWFHVGAKLTPPRVVSLGSDLLKQALFIKVYQVTCTFIYLLKEHIHSTTSIEQHIHALFFVYVCYNEYWTTYTCVYTLKEHIHVFILLKNI